MENRYFYMVIINGYITKLNKNDKDGLGKVLRKNLKGVPKYQIDAFLLDALQRVIKNVHLGNDVDMEFKNEFMCKKNKYYMLTLLYGERD